MIKEKHININIVGRNINVYKNLGYKCYVGKKLTIDVKDLQKNSHYKITAICDKCKTQKTLSYYAYNKNIKKYDTYLCNNCKQIKIEKTNMIKYGTKRPIQNKEIRKKLEQTNLKKYNNKIASKNTNIINKIISTNLKRWNETSSAKNIIIKTKQRNTIIGKLLKKYKSYNILSIVDDQCEFKCNKNHIYHISFSNLHNRLKQKSTLCTICNPINDNNISDKEIQILKFINIYYNDKILHSNRNIIPPLELDIYLPDLNLAFEFNGLYWHSESYKDKNYHLNKTEECEQKGIQLIHIWEDDWVYKQDIIKSIILNKLGKTPNKIYGRKTEVREVFDNKLVREFLNKNHLQGFVGSKVKLGLFYENELVSLMTFGKRRISMGKKSTNEGEWELLRFCNKLNTNVLGGASKLFKYFINNYEPKEIITYADRSHSNGNLYKQLKFNYIGKTQSNYYYIVDGIRNHRFNFRKDKLIKEGFDPNKTEHDIMIDRNIFRIYDSGNLKYKLFIN